MNPEYKMVDVPLYGTCSSFRRRSPEIRKPSFVSFRPEVGVYEDVELAVFPPPPPVPARGLGSVSNCSWPSEDWDWPSEDQEAGETVSPVVARRRLWRRLKLVLLVGAVTAGLAVCAVGLGVALGGYV